MRTATRTNCPYHVLLIADGGTGDAKRLPGAWTDPEHAAQFGGSVAGEHFTGSIEIVVVHTMTAEAVINRIVVVENQPSIINRCKDCGRKSIAYAVSCPVCGGEMEGVQ